jgi:hypothetical protein
MMRICLFWLLISMGSTTALAQKAIIPVRIDHKWGYIGTNGKVMIPPKYDGLGEESVVYHYNGPQKYSQYRMVSVGAKCGLLDRQRKEVLPPEFNRIFVLADTLFAVQTDSGFYLMNRKRRRLLDLSAYDDVQLHDPENRRLSNVLLIKKNFRWGAMRMDGTVLIPPQYHQIAPQTDCSSLFVVTKTFGGLKGIVDQHNKIILPFEYTDLIVMRDDCFARREKEGWYFMSRNGRLILKDFYHSISRINSHIYLVSQDKGVALFSVTEKKMLTKLDVNYRYAAVDDDYIVKYIKDTIPVNVLNAEGIPLKIGDKNIFSIQAASEGFYPVSLHGIAGKRYWGLWKPGLDSLSVPCVYTAIHPFYDSLAIVELDKKKGLINQSLKEVLPPGFKSVRRENQYVKAENDSLFLVFTLTASGELERAEKHTNVQTIRVVSSDSVYELGRADLQRRVVKPDPEYRKSTPVTQWINRYAWQYDAATQTFQLYHGDTLQSPLVAEYVDVLKNFDMALVFARDSTIRNDFTRLMVRDEETPMCRMALYDYCKGRFITGFDFLGLRTIDFIEHHPRAVFVDLEGRMGLIDFFGAQTTTADGKPFRCAFIDEYHRSYARYCREGKLAEADEVNVNTTWEMPPLQGIFRFTTPRQSPVSYQYRHYTIQGDQPDQSPPWGLVDDLGKEAVTPRFDYIQGLNKYGAIARSGINWGVVGFKGDTILDFQYRWISDYDNYWKIIVRNPATFYFSSDGHKPAVEDSLRTAKTTAQKMIGSKRFDQTMPFRKNRSIGKINGSACILDQQGNFQYLMPGDRAAGWRQGFFVVDTLMRRSPTKTRNMHFQYLNAEGVNEFGKTFTDLKQFQYGLGQVKKGYFWGVVNQFGLYRIQPKYVLLDLKPDGVEVRVPTMIGLADKKGKIVIPPEYDHIERLNGGYFRVERGDAIGYRHYDGTWLWEIRE